MSDNPALPTPAAPAALDLSQVTALQTELEQIQLAASRNEADATTIRRGIDIIRMLRRTNTGPSATRGRKTAVKGPAFDPLALLDQQVGGKA